MSCGARSRLKRSEEETVRRLAAAVEARDHETAEHIERVGDFSALVAQCLDLEPAHCELIRRASPLHDIGKIGVPDEILLKPGPLTPGEMPRCSVTRRSATTSSAAPTRPARPRGEIAWTHHERVDGTGYPRGLAGTEIPLEGRIVRSSTSTTR